MLSLNMYVYNKKESNHEVSNCTLPFRP